MMLGDAFAPSRGTPLAAMYMVSISQAELGAMSTLFYLISPPSSDTSRVPKSKVPMSPWRRLAVMAG